MPETITGELVAHRVVGRDFWSIATIKTRDAGKVPAVGKLLGADLGDSVELEGEWSDHPTFGRQFKVSACAVVAPQTDAGVIAWLSSKLPHVGAARARAMIDHFGGPAELWEIIETAPARLVEVHGITAARVSDVVDAYLRFRYDRDRMVRFRGWGMTEYQIARILAVWGDEAEEKLRENPYELARVVDGFGFLRADAIAQRMGVPKDSTARIECGLAHTMAQAAGHGHTYVPTGKLVKIAAEKVLRIEADPVALQLKKMRLRGELVAHGKKTFSRGLNEAEKQCADAIRAFLEIRKGGTNEASA